MNPSNKSTNKFWFMVSLLGSVFTAAIIGLIVGLVTGHASTGWLTFA